MTTFRPPEGGLSQPHLAPKTRSSSSPSSSLARRLEVALRSSRCRSRPLSASPCFKASAACLAQRARPARSSPRRLVTWVAPPFRRVSVSPDRREHARPAFPPRRRPPAAACEPDRRRGARACASCSSVQRCSASWSLRRASSTFFVCSPSGSSIQVPFWSIFFASSSAPSAPRPLCAASSAPPCSSECAICSANSRAAAPLLVQESLPMPIGGRSRARPRARRLPRGASSSSRSAAAARRRPPRRPAPAPSCRSRQHAPA